MIMETTGVNHQTAAERDFRDGTTVATLAGETVMRKTERRMASRGATMLGPIRPLAREMARIRR